MYLVADISVEICAAKSCKLCTQYCPEANTIQYSDEMGNSGTFRAPRLSPQGSSWAPSFLNLTWRKPLLWPPGTVQPMWRWTVARDARNVCGCAITWRRTMPSR